MRDFDRSHVRNWSFSLQEGLPNRSAVHDGGFDDVRFVGKRRIGEDLAVVSGPGARIRRGGIPDEPKIQPGLIAIVKVSAVRAAAAVVIYIVGWGLDRKIVGLVGLGRGSRFLDRPGRR